MDGHDGARYVAFSGSDLIGRGMLREVAEAAKASLDRDPARPVAVFDAATSEPVELDLRGSVADVLARLPEGEGDVGTPPAPRRPGRPRLGVVPREVTLLPRHWEWLASQPGGASVTLRKLVDQARRANAEGDRVRIAREAAYRFMLAMAGDEAGYEEAVRALFAGDQDRLCAATATWPVDVRDHARELARVALPGEACGDR